MNTYKLENINESDFLFITSKGLKYILSVTDSTATYKTKYKESKSIKLFRFSLEDEKYAYGQDRMTKNTIVDFIFKYILSQDNDSFVFFINNEYEEKTNRKYRGIHRLKLFKRMMTVGNKYYNEDYIFLTNQHFILDPRHYRGDYVGAIIKSSSEDYGGIIRSFYSFCYKHSYKNK